MATLINLWKASESDALRQKVQAAAAIAALGILQEATSTANHAARMVWAREAIAQPEKTGNAILWAVLAQFTADTAPEIGNKTDAEIQTAVNAAVAGLAV